MTPDPLVGRTLDGRYRIDAVLATGGMGRIYKAEQLGLRRTVAIKVLTADPTRELHDPLFRERFTREAEMASSLTSPHTITIFHYGRTDDDVYYIVMEFVDGVTLGQLLRREGRLPIARATSILNQVCLSLGEAHERGIVHRDVKPSNIMLIHGRHDQVKVLDFGIAKQLSRDGEGVGQELTSSRSYIGTAEYMAPECFDGRVDHRSDIYSVGVVLYLALTGRLPFKGTSATQTILMVLKDAVPAIEPVLSLPGPLEEIIFACLEKDPANRPSTVDEVLHVLQACQLQAQSAAFGVPFPDTDVEVVIERPADSPSTSRRSMAARPGTSMRALARRNPLKTFLAGVVLLAIGGTAGLMVRLAMRDDREAAAPSAATATVASPAAASQAPVTPPPAAAIAPPPAAVVAPPAAATAPPAATAPAAATAPPAEVEPDPPKDTPRSSSRRPSRSAPESTRKKRSSSERGAKSDDSGRDGYKESPY
jgi:tRNA A-37 threonylcarbamoyl transferase component Bud32